MLIQITAYQIYFCFASILLNPFFVLHRKIHILKTVSHNRFFILFLV